MRFFTSLLCFIMIGGCGSNDVPVIKCGPDAREPTGDLERDLVGFWRCDADGDGVYLCGFNADGTMDRFVDGSGNVAVGVATWSVSEDRLLITSQNDGPANGTVVFQVVLLRGGSVELEVVENGFPDFAWAEYWSREDCSIH